MTFINFRSSIAKPIQPLIDMSDLLCDHGKLLYNAEEIIDEASSKYAFICQELLTITLIPLPNIHAWKQSLSVSKFDIFRGWQKFVYFLYKYMSQDFKSAIKQQRFLYEVVIS